MNVNLNPKPLISIITVVKNAEETIEKCISSVIKQKYDNIEYIIVDGGSTDKSIEIIKKYNEKIDKLVVEPDNGIWDAMNKGIKLSKGDIIGFLNSGDVYFPGVLNLVNNYFLKTSLLEIFHLFL